MVVSDNISGSTTVLAESKRLLAPLLYTVFVSAFLLTQSLAMKIATQIELLIVNERTSLLVVNERTPLLIVNERAPFGITYIVPRPVRIGTCALRLVQLQPQEYILNILIGYRDLKDIFDLKTGKLKVSSNTPATSTSILNKGGLCASLFARRLLFKIVCRTGIIETT